MSALEVGVITFAETFPPGGHGDPPTARERLRQVVAEACAAEQAGLAVYGVGEHHRPDFAASAPAVILAAIAEHTQHIRLTSAATVLGCTDPVRLFQDFATLDLLSGGRAEMIVGKGSFQEAPPLFGHTTESANQAFTQNLQLLTLINRYEKTSWPAGNHRPAIDDCGIYPRPETPLPLWAAVTNTPASATHAGALGLPIVLGWFGQPLQHLRHLARIYRDTAHQHGHKPRLAIQVHGHIADTTEQAIAEYYPAYAATLTRLRAQHGHRSALTREQFDRMSAPEGHLLIGDPHHVAHKIQQLHTNLGIERILIHISAAALPHETVLHAITLLGQTREPFSKTAHDAGSCCEYASTKLIPSNWPMRRCIKAAGPG